MKRWSFGLVSLVFVALCMFAGGNVSTFGQDCLTGQCVKSPSDRVVAKVAEVVVAAVEVLPEVRIGRDLRGPLLPDALDLKAAADLIQDGGPNDA